MNLETLQITWEREAFAHNYHGFIVILDTTKGIDRIFFREDDYTGIKETLNDNDIEIISEVWV